MTTHPNTQFLNHSLEFVRTHSTWIVQVKVLEVLTQLTFFRLVGRCLLRQSLFQLLFKPSY
jgi:hypothetical protein